MIRRCNAGSSAGNHLATHKLAVIFAQCTWQRLVSRIAHIGTSSPLPAVTKELGNTISVCRCWMQTPYLKQISVPRRLASNEFPFGLCGESAATPARECIGFEETYMAYAGYQAARKARAAPSA